jgi:hypothetical protein
MAPWSEKPMPGVLKAALVAVQVYAFYFACSSAYNIRLHAVNEYGRIIHEFDPWCVPAPPARPAVPCEHAHVPASSTVRPAVRAFGGGRGPVRAALARVK